MVEFPGDIPQIPHGLKRVGAGGWVNGRPVGARVQVSGASKECGWKGRAAAQEKER